MKTRIESRREFYKKEGLTDKQIKRMLEPQVCFYHQCKEDLEALKKKLDEQWSDAPKF